MASALITTPSRRSAIASAKADLPLAVGPAITITLLFVMAGEETPAALRLQIGRPRLNDRGVMQNVLVLIANPARPSLNDAAVGHAADTLHAAGATVGAADWLAPGIACDLPFDGPAAAVALPGVDAVVVPARGR